MAEKRGRTWRTWLVVLVGVALFVGGVWLAEWLAPSEDLPPIVPEIERSGDRVIVIQAGIVDRLELGFEERSVEQVDAIYRCLERELERAFGRDSEPQGGSRWKRRVEVNRRMEAVRQRCVD